MNKKGFTLIELVITIIIMAILSGFAVMYYEKFIERMRIAEADTIIGTSLTAQERNYLKFQRYTPYWHQLDAAPIPVRIAKEQNDYANGKDNTVFYTRGGVLTGIPNPGFAISFEQDATERWFVVARRVGKGGYTYQIVRPFDSQESVCVPNWSSEKDLEICMEYMGVTTTSELQGNPMVPKLPSV